jgi:hypothetical protein
VSPGARRQEGCEGVAETHRVPLIAPASMYEHVYGLRRPAVMRPGPG